MNFQPRGVVDNTHVTSVRQILNGERDFTHRHGAIGNRYVICGVVFDGDRLRAFPMQLHRIEVNVRFRRNVKVDERPLRRDRTLLLQCSFELGDGEFDRSPFARRAQLGDRRMVGIFLSGIAVVKNSVVPRVPEQE